eukprot:COSAG01_NODE_286_length_19421_cov_123.895663_28_plen_75_part_00
MSHLSLSRNVEDGNAWTGLAGQLAGQLRRWLEPWGEPTGGRGRAAAESADGAADGAVPPPRHNLITDRNSGLAG